MKVVRADPIADGARVATFFNETELSGSIDFKIRRTDFFAQYRFQSDDFETLMMVDDDGKIHGVVSLIFHTGFIHGEKQRWALATDLRISNTRQAVVQWSDLFLPALQEARDRRNCRYVFAAVIQHDNLAYNALIRPQSERRKLPRYYLLNRFRVIAIHGRWPFSRDPLPAIEIQHAKASDLEAASQYLQKKAIQRLIASDHQPANLAESIQRRPGMKIEDMLIARDKKNNIVGLTIPWRNDSVSAWVPSKYHSLALGIYSALWWFSKIRVVQPLPPVGSPIQSKILTHLTVDNPDILMAILDHAYNETKGDEILMYPYFRNDWKMLPPRSFIATSLPWGLYSILPPGEPQPEWLIPDQPQKYAPEFDISWL
jgi:hypothetical protein